MIEKIQLLLNHTGPGSDTHPFHSHSVGENPAPKCEGTESHPRPGWPLRLSVAEGGVQIRGQLAFSAPCHSRLNAESQRWTCSSRGLYMVVLRPELGSVCLINSSFHCATLPLPGGVASPPWLRGKGWDLTLKLWLHQPDALSRLQGLCGCWHRLPLQSVGQNGGNSDYEPCLRSQRARC